MGKFHASTYNPWSDTSEPIVTPEAPDTTHMYPPEPMDSTSSDLPETQHSKSHDSSIQWHSHTLDTLQALVALTPAIETITLIGSEIQNIFVIEPKDDIDEPQCGYQ